MLLTNLIDYLIFIYISISVYAVDGPGNNQASRIFQLSWTPDINLKMDVSSVFHDWYHFKIYGKVT